jgi:hypothetical protein
VAKGDIAIVMFRALAVVAAVLPSAVYALCPAQPVTLCGAYSSGAKMFVGTVTSVKYLDDYSRIEYTVRTNRTIQGDVRAVEILHSENDSGRWPAREGETYIVITRDGRIGGSCDKWELPGHVEEGLRELESCKAKVDR